MSSHLDFVYHSLRGTAVRAAAEGIGLALAVTGDELIAVKSGWFSHWGARLERFPLETVRKLRRIYRPSMGIMEIQLAGGRAIRVSYEPEATPDFDDLERAIGKRPWGGV